MYLILLAFISSCVAFAPDVVSRSPIFIPLDFSTILQKMDNNEINRIYFNNEMNKVVSIANDDNINYITNIKPIVSNTVFSEAATHHIPVYFEKSNELLDFALNPFTIFILGSIFLNTIGRNMNIVNMNKPSNFFGINNNIKLNEIKTNVTFSDWGGSEEVLNECYEIVSYLKNASNYKNVGAEIPRGIMLDGPPGTGKTLLAKAIATDSNSSFISVSGSEFVEMFVGVGAMRIRSLFEQARQNKPCIIFIDEIDAIGKQRGQSGVFTNDEREQTLNQLLVEMDGFKSNDDIIVIAATNRKDILDKALLRPGRFDRSITIPLPDRKSRRDILNVYLRNRKLDYKIDLDSLVDLTAGYSGAELKNLINEASIFAARQGQTMITQDYLNDAFEKISIGIIKKNDDRDLETKTRVSIHECGHALQVMLNENYFNLQKVTIKQTYSGAGGYTLFSEKSEIIEGGLYTKDLLKKRLTIALGGKAAEEIYYGNDFISAGATMDLNQANQLALSMIEKYGMGNKLSNFYKQNENQFNNKYSELTKNVIDKEVSNLVNEAYEDAKKNIINNKEKFDLVLKELLNKKTISGYEFNLIINSP
jgi:cell division protease FtsH